MQVVIRIDLAAALLILAGGALLIAVTVRLIARYYRRRAEQHWHNVLANLPWGVVLCDATGRQIFTNDVARELLPKLRAAQLEQAWQAATSDVQQSSILHGQDVVVQIQSWPLQATGQALITLRDIRQQQRAEENYRRFIHTLSHELLTPLTAIQGHLSHISANIGAQEPAWIGSLHVVRGEIERLTRLTSNLLILSRLEAGQPLQRKPTNLTAVAEEAVLQLLEKADARQISLHVNAALALPRPPLDRDAWKQIFLNLIDNGIKYGKEQGSVQVALARANGSLVISVVDDGAGIPPDDLPHLFVEMFRADAHRHVSGSGLGLTIVRKIVEQHGGQITCTSTPGSGTTFKIELPLTESVTPGQ
jgi:signal transduction histidine kinase